jgi:glycosyltransferase involved in cell wall biosynthesis
VIEYEEPLGPGMSVRRPSVAVLIPCHNEEASIGKVVSDFRRALPFAPIFVYDNNSTDHTVACAQAAGAIVCREPLPGKGNVVRRMFADTEADVFVLVDGDDTYDANSAPMLIARLLREHLDMVNASRVAISQQAYRRGHRFGNAMLSGFVSWAFGKRQSDLMSGYRVLSRRFVKSFPAIAAGFEVETELTVHALELRLPLAEVPTPYRERPLGSTSKLRTYRDGILILRTILRLIKEEKPLQFFALGFAVLAASSVGLEIPVLTTYMHTGLVPRLPTALLGTGLMLLAFLSLTCGLILDTVTRGRIELKRLHYLALPLDHFDPEWIESLEKARR